MSLYHSNSVLFIKKNSLKKNHEIHCDREFIASEEKLWFKLGMVKCIIDSMKYMKRSQKVHRKCALWKHFCNPTCFVICFCILELPNMQPIINKGSNKLANLRDRKKLHRSINSVF